MKIIKQFSLCIKQRHVEYGYGLRILGSGIHVVSHYKTFSVMLPNSVIRMIAGVSTRSLPQFYLEKCLRRVLETVTSLHSHGS